MHRLLIGLAALLFPATLFADARISDSVGFGRGYGCAPHPGYVGWGASAGWVHRSTIGGWPGWYGHRPGFVGRYAVPQVYGPARLPSDFYYRSSLYRNDFDFRSSLYRGDFHNRGSLYTKPLGGNSYYGPALERYQRDARDAPSYHFDRRESYIRGQNWRR